MGLLHLEDHYLLPDYARLSAHRAREPLAEQRRHRRSRARAGRARRLRAHRGPPDRSAEGEGALVRAAGDGRARQGRLPRGDGLLRSPHHRGHLVSAAEPRLPPAGGRGHRRDGELRVAARPHRPRARVPRDGRRAHAEGAARCAEVRTHVRQQRPAARPRGRRQAAGRFARRRGYAAGPHRDARALCRRPPRARAERARDQVVQARGRPDALRLERRSRIRWRRMARCCAPSTTSRIPGCSTSIPTRRRARSISTRRRAARAGRRGLLRRLDGPRDRGGRTRAAAGTAKRRNPRRSPT